MEYVGEYKDGKKHGQGTYTWFDGGINVGKWKDGKRTGQGTSTYPNGDKYVGEYKNGKRNGQGTYSYPDGRKNWVNLEKVNLGTSQYTVNPE